MRVFFDTNVLVSAFATRGLCADLFAHILIEHELVVGEVVLSELRKNLRQKLGLPKSTIDEIEALLRESTVVRRPPKHLGLGIGDPDDEWVVASAVEGGADVLVTGDQAVLDIARRAPLRIVSPRGLWELLRSSGPDDEP
ncbi:MAG: putative toxin-antitoxin system toxin component, PIN family [Deltaproteobacteria bacterium]|nr:putative toxin-antitoxin system toxin component, PIN family [Deltaproteobacteria bacterium]